MVITWAARGAGNATAAPTDPHPGLFRLTAPGGSFHQFDGSAGPSLTPTLTFATTGYYGIYIETTTTLGRRQFKFVPTNAAGKMRFGYRYEVGLGSDSRNGELNTRALDLVSLAARAEPSATITSVDRIFVRVGGEMRIEVADQATPPPPPPPPSGTFSDAEIVRFLNQTSFGASDETIAAVRRAGSFDTWIDQQLDLPVSLTEPYVMANSNNSSNEARHLIWWRNLMEEPDQLRQRLAFAWSQIFVVSDRDYILSNSQYGISNYYDMLATHGAGNFRDLLERVTLHPVMGVYLSMLRNEKADPARNIRPDENFAREVLQLFTIGLYELDDRGEVRTDVSGRPVPTFDQTVIEEFAKVFTGWNFDGVRSWTDNNVPISSMQTPMVPEEAFHDTTAKSLLGGMRLPAGRSAAIDMSDALDNIFAHANVGPFVSRLLIQRLVTSNPTSQYVGRVAAVFDDNGSGVRGDLRSVTRALLLDPEARTGPTTLPATFGKIKEPVLRLTNLWRALDARPGPQANGNYRPYARAAYRIEDVLGQAVMRSRSVFNFYQPDYRLEPASPLAGPEMQILSEINVASTNNMMLQCVYGDNNRSNQYRQNITQIQIESEVVLAADVEALLDRLDLILAAGQLPARVRSAIIALISAHPSDDEGRYRRVIDAIYCIVGSPFHLVQK